MNITHIGIDLAKSTFSVHGIDAQGHTRLQRTVSRSQLSSVLANVPACTVAMEACGGAHHWARTLRQYGHQVRLIHPRLVKPFVKSHKNDRNDAQVICEASVRPSMRFVAVKTVEQQGELTLHRARQLLSTQRTALMNQLRALLHEFSIVCAQGAPALRRCVAGVLEGGEVELPGLALETFAELYEQWDEFEQRLSRYDARIQARVKADEQAKRLMQVPGIGPISASATLATVGDIRSYDNARQFAAALGLVPRHYATGGKTRYGRITKRGDAYLRTLLIHGARAALRTAHRRNDAVSGWALELKARRATNKAVVALAAKHARIIWAMLARDQDFQPRALSA